MRFNAEEMRDVVSVVQAVRAEFRDALAGLWKQVSCCALLIAVWACDWALMLEVWRYLWAPTPGQEQLWSVGFLSATSTLMFALYHREAKARPDGPLVAVVRILSVLGVVAFCIGAAGTLAAAIWENGVQALFGGSGGLAGQVTTILGQGAQQTEPSAMGAFLEKHIFPALAILFTVGSGTLSLCAMQLSHRLLEGIEARKECGARLVAARGRLRVAKLLLENMDRQDELAPRYAALERELEESKAESADKVHVALQEGVAAGEAMLVERLYVHIPAAGSIPQRRERTPHDDLNVAEVERRLEEIRGFDTATILRILNE